MQEGNSVAPLVTIYLYTADTTLLERFSTLCIVSADARQMNHTVCREDSHRIVSSAAGYQYRTLTGTQ